MSLTLNIIIAMAGFEGFLWALFDFERFIKACLALISQPDNYDDQRSASEKKAENEQWDLKSE